MRRKTNRIKPFHKSFFATRGDLLPNVLRFESKAKVQYALMGLFDRPTPALFDSAADIPKFGIAERGHHVWEASYLVIDAGAAVIFEEEPGTDGKVMYRVALAENQDVGFTFQPAGRHGRKSVIPGHVAGSANKASIERCERFWRALGDGFVQVGSYYIGPEAYQLAKKGARLTLGKPYPRDMDTRIE
jgi:hypothetical protein